MTQRFVPNRTISLGHEVITQHGLVQCDFLTVDYFLTFLRDKCSSRSFEITIITLFFFLDGQSLTMGVVTSHPTKPLCPRPESSPGRNNRSEREEAASTGMRRHCKAQLFTSHQARRSQRHDMSQHAKAMQVRTPPLPRNQAATKRVKGGRKKKKSLSSRTGAKL